jgi:hypothetical protein
VETTGDTGLLPGIVIDKFAFRAVNDRLKECVKVKEPGDSKFEEDKIVSKEAFEEERNRLEVEGKAPPTFVQPTPATCSTRLLGISRVARRADSFISAASFQETTKVLTEAALAGKVDYLVGLKENVILGHLVPAGTGFRSHQEARVLLRPSPGCLVSEDGKAIVEIPPEALGSEAAGVSCSDRLSQDGSVEGDMSGNVASRRTGTAGVPQGETLTTAGVSAEKSQALTPGLLMRWQSRLQSREQEIARRALETDHKHGEAERLLEEAQRRSEAIAEQEAKIREHQEKLDGSEAALRQREGMVGKREEKVRAWLSDGDRREKVLQRQEQELARRESESEQRLRSRAEQVEQEEKRVREAERQHEREAADLRGQKAAVEKARLDLEARRRALERLETALRDREANARRREAALNEWEERLRQQGGRPPAAGVLQASPPRRLVTVPGKWYSRPASATGVAWGFCSDTPRSVPVDGDHLYCFRVSQAAKDQDLGGMADLADLDRLRNLQLEGCTRVTDAGLAPVSALGNLHLLMLEGCPEITDGGLAHLRGLGRLSWLSLARCDRITDNGLAHLRSLVSLQVLLLDGCHRITDRGLAHLHGLPSLRRLDLHGVPRAGLFKGLLGARGITNASMAALVAAIPGCEIRGVKP